MLEEGQDALRNGLHHLHSCTPSTFQHPPSAGTSNTNSPPLLLVPTSPSPSLLVIWALFCTAAHLLGTASLPQGLVASSATPHPIGVGWSLMCLQDPLQTSIRILLMGRLLVTLPDHCFCFLLSLLPALICPSLGVCWQETRSAFSHQLENASWKPPGKYWLQGRVILQPARIFLSLANRSVLCHPQVSPSPALLGVPWTRSQSFTREESPQSLPLGTSHLINPSSKQFPLFTQRGDERD